MAVDKTFFPLDEAEGGGGGVGLEALWGGGVVPLVHLGLSRGSALQAQQGDLC